MPTFQTVRGTRDLLPVEARILRGIIRKASETAELYGYKEIITPILESFELLNTKSGEEIRSRMFKFEDLGKREIVLRPEFTASIARLVTTAFKKAPLPLKFFSVGTVYRYDEPQQGRYREFWQSNFELMGSNKPEADAEVILLTNQFLKKAGIRNYAFKLGHVGILRGIMSQDNIDEQTQNAVLQKMDKRDYTAALNLLLNYDCTSIFMKLFLLNSSNPRFSKNPLSVIKKVGKLVQDYGKASIAVQNLTEILKRVTESGCKIETVDPAFARGLEYYTGMIFEVYIPELNIALGGGGRYDKLIETFGGEPTPAVGVAHGLDRIALAKEKQKSHEEHPKRRTHKKRVIVIPAVQDAKGKALKITEKLRKERIRTEFEIMGRTVDKALKKAKARKMDYAVIVGEPHLSENDVVLLDLSDVTSNENKSFFLTVNMLIKKLKTKKQ